MLCNNFGQDGIYVTISAGCGNGTCLMLCAGVCWQLLACFFLIVSCLVMQKSLVGVCSHHESWVSGRRVKNRGFDLTQGKSRKFQRSRSFLGKRPRCANVTRRYAAALGIMCHSVLAHCVASHKCMPECVFVNMSQSEAKTCDGDLQRGIASRNCGENLRR